ncbi:DUF2088 domain-containing protein, partial [bacterium]|nr:DUF2088 domain-containing protein [bacterium]
MAVGKGYVDGSLSADGVRELAVQGLDQAELNGKRVLIIVPDSTRTAPLPMIFRLFCDLLRPRVAKLDFLVALGTHPPMPEDKLNQLLG